MRSQQHWRKAQVIATENVAEDVRAVTFSVPMLTSSFDPGSHTRIRLQMNGIMAQRTYTVLPSAAKTLKIAVKLHPNSRGGSKAVWALKPGDETEMTEPENRFELSWRAQSYLLIAGGIGVTPIYGMAKALVAKGQAVRMIYGAKSRTQMAFASELDGLLGPNIEYFLQDEGRNFDLAQEFANLPPDGEAYICGPIGLLNAAKAAWEMSGRPISRLRYEVFGDSGQFSEQAFQVRIPELGKTIDVRQDQTMLDALMLSGVDMVFDCQRGECGLCAVSIVEASETIDHRDVFFSAEQRDENLKMCACVSRLPGGVVSIDTGYRR